MLEKIGLPPKPSARGRSWVVDASHCQQCSSPFSIFNRKHHCRRCGGLFCGNCVQSRMVLRGQGDAAVRICEPCKKLEEATRFEARQGRRRKEENTIESDESLLKSLLNDHDVENASSSSSSKDVTVTPESLRQQAQEEKAKFLSLKKEGKPEAASKAFKRAKELERQADALALALRKSRIKTSKITKSSANDEEATKGEIPETKEVVAEKKYRGSMTVDDKQDLMKELKELGWSDADLDKKQVSDAELLGENEQSKAATPSAAAGALQMEILGHKRKALALKREGNLAGAKEELKKAKQLERRLEELQTLGEDIDEDEEEDVDEVTVILKALEREVDGKNVLSTKQQPVPLTADSLPIFREEDETHIDVSDTDMSDPDMIAALKAMGWTEEAGALESLNAPFKPQPAGGANKEEIQAEIVSHKRKALALKRAGNLAEARKELQQAKSLEKMLESSAEDQDVEQVDVTEQDMKDPEFLGALQALGFGGEEPAALVADLKVKRRDKLTLQQEILAVKRSALALKRQGKDAESMQQFEQAKILEQQLQNFNQQTVVKQTSARTGSYRSSRVESEDEDEDEDDGDVTKHIKDITSDPELAAVLKGLSLDEKTEEAPSDTPVPASSKAVKSRVPKAIGELPQRSKLEIQKELLGKKRKALALRREGKEEEAEKELKEASILDMQLKELEQAERKQQPPSQGLNPVESEEEDEDDGNILNTEVNEDDMNDPTMLATLTDMGFKDDGPAEQQNDDDGFEGEYGEIGLTVDIVPPLFSRKEKQQNDGHLKAAAVKQKDSSIAAAVVQQQDGHFKAAAQKREERHTSESKRKQVTETEAFATVARPQEQREKVVLSNSTVEKPPPSIEQQVMEHKRRALNLKRSGDIAGAREELRQAKLLEKQEQQKQVQAGDESHQHQLQHELGSTKREQQPSRSKDRMKLQQESLAHKRKALGLRREGKVTEAEAEFEIAKSLEKQMEELEPQQQHRHAAAGVDEDGVEDVLDSQLLAALAGIGWKDTEIFSSRATTAAPALKDANKMASVSLHQQNDLQEKIRGLKLRALELKRNGKQQEALNVLREAKKLEKGIPT